MCKAKWMSRSSTFLFVSSPHIEPSKSIHVVIDFKSLTMLRPFPCTLQYILTTFQSLLLFYFLTNDCMDWTRDAFLHSSISAGPISLKGGMLGACGETTNPSLHLAPSWFFAGRQKTQQNMICTCKTGRGEDFFPFFSHINLPANGFALCHLHCF